MTISGRRGPIALSDDTATRWHTAIAERLGLSADTNMMVGSDETFLAWCERLGRAGLEVDGHPFELERRPALRAIYAAVPSEKREFYRLRFAIMKGAQTGLTVFTFLLICYIAMKFMPVKVGAYYPDRTLAAYTSASRFMPTLRTIPPAYEALLQENKGGEGNVLTRRLGKSEVIYLWTSGGSATESFPLDMVVADEVQNMLVADIEKIMERMSGSDLRFFFACSTAKNPEADIDALFRQGNQQRFHTRCKCEGGVVLDEAFPNCIVFHGDGRWPGAPEDFVYYCPRCGTYIADPQDGEWVAENPKADPLSLSWHLPQTLSPTVSPREMIQALKHATDLANFHQRKLGRPWNDPDEVPITLEICERQGRAGMEAGLEWKSEASGTYMGIDQMGSFNVVIIVERMPDGRMALCHAEFVYDDDPFARCSILMAQYGVRICVLEQLPNVNDARRFANKHLGKVFLAGYADLRDDMLQWSDQLTSSDRKTASDAVTRYTVTLNQYKTMQAALFRIKDGFALFPDPAALHQDVRFKEGKRRVAILREVVFDHFTKTALVVEQDEETRRPRPRVKKIAIDPHASYAWMLANVAWSREQGMGTIFVPAAMVRENKVQRLNDSGVVHGGLPAQIEHLMTNVPTSRCGRCTGFNPKTSMCEERMLGAQAVDAACVLYVLRED